MRNFTFWTQNCAIQPCEFRNSGNSKNGSGCNNVVLNSTQTGKLCVIKCRITPSFVGKRGGVVMEEMRNSRVLLQFAAYEKIEQNFDLWTSCLFFFFPSSVIIKLEWQCFPVTLMPCENIQGYCIKIMQLKLC